MQIAPILAALRRHRLAALLIALEIALACAVLCNACFLVVTRLNVARIDSGVEDASLALLRLSGCGNCSETDLNARVLAALRGVRGVQAAAVVNSAPFGPQAGNMGITVDHAHYVGVPHFYMGGEGAAETLGLKLVAGRRFLAEDYRTVTSFFPADAQVWITRSLAEHLWPGQDALGKEFWSGKDYHYRVIGVVDRLSRPNPELGGSITNGWSVFLPGQPGKGLSGTYLLRADPHDLDRVLGEARAAVTKAAPEMVLDGDYSRTLVDLRHRYFRQSRAMAGILVGVMLAMLLVTALGIVGLASFWVQQRRRQIGVRRAIGATRGDILRYFQTENFLIVGGGILLGTVLAYAINLVLMRQYELPHLPFRYLPVGAAALWLLGQLAVLGPALRAAAVPPVVATRAA